MFQGGEIMKKTIKQNLKGFLLGAIVVAILMSTAIGEQVRKTISVIHNSVNITLNNEKVDISTLLYGGTTYVPLREIAEILGQEVDWDGDTNTANIYNKGTNNAIADMDKISQENYETIASQFNIDLSEYRHIKPADEEYKSSNLFVLRLQFDSNAGDLVPRIYLDKSNKSGVILKQDKNGLNYAYNFEADGDRWIITDITEKQGEILEGYPDMQE